MAEQKVLTAEQVACIEEQWPELASSCPWDELIASHKLLQSQLVNSQKDTNDWIIGWRMASDFISRLTERLAEVRTQLAYEQERGLNNRLGWDLEMQDTVADVRALAAAGKTVITWYHSLNPAGAFNAMEAVQDALARPGVQRVLAEGRPTA